ncbi:CoA ester lyase [Blastococcus sp. BMG 814]|uniref:CoA ester lyase n=1 Tax=Blastococcus carthaginiensis TaxID=3050034 RepID=A0ABT9I6N6_9ACTN|nr:CoA ester lyase [Blastococcus carthaginiensis]MDP5181226.1 CoA ester lyase [Blastococcus carthaginiensis]
MNAVPRSWLYVPGHRDDRVAKALTAGADAVVVDLEDAVPAAQKDRARELTTALLDEHRPGGPQLWVRINPPGTEAGERDLAALAGRRADGVRVPRAEDPDAVRAVGDRLGLPMQLLLESARGLWRAHELAAAHGLVAGIGLGEADLAADLLVDRDEGLHWARGAVVVAARAAGLPSPVQSVWTDVGDLDGLRASSRTGRVTGFFGRSVVHPRQLGPVHEVYTPSPEERAAAERVVATAAAAAQRGESAVLDADGRFVDPAVVARARTVLDRAAPSDQPAPAPSSGETR